MLLHPSSLPGAGYSGDLGADARRFVDLMAAAGLQIWQVLPLGPTHADLCPYQSFSVHAGNPDLIDLQWLVEQGWLSQQQAERGQTAPSAKRLALDLASKAFFTQVRPAEHPRWSTAYDRFLQKRDSGWRIMCASRPSGMSWDASPGPPGHRPCGTATRTPATSAPGNWRNK